MTILIPAYEPDSRLIDLIKRIKQICDYTILIVDDGSGLKYQKIFETAKLQGCTVLSHQKNMGKGHALKTGFRYIINQATDDGVVSADSDGQHSPEDIVRVANQISESSNEIVIGSRHFTGKVPFRSRFGNTLTRIIFTFSTGLKLYDTQTGLRGFSPDMLDWLCNIPGERFEYEMNMLLSARDNGYSFKEIEIATVYLDNNKSTHFRAIKDSVKVYLPIVKFSTASVISALIDVVILITIQCLTSNLLFSVVSARAASSILNYALNNFFVFAKGQQTTEVKKTMPKYFVLVLLILLFNYSLMYLFNEITGIPLIFSKLLTEFILFIFSYWTQNKYIFNTSGSQSEQREM